MRSVPPELPARAIRRSRRMMTDADWAQKRNTLQVKGDAYICSSPKRADLENQPPAAVQVAAKRPA